MKFANLLRPDDTKKNALIVKIIANFVIITHHKKPSIIMPELPEVETTIRGLAPHLENVIIDHAIVRCPKLRWAVPESFGVDIAGQNVRRLTRRGKYILMQMNNGTVIIHLGMSGRLCLYTKPEPPKRHDHIDIVLRDGRLLRYTDPRRFGAILWTQADPCQHVLLKHLGVEPLSDQFTVDYVLEKAANRRLPIKSFIMDSKIIVGIGNIYAAESLFLAKIHPEMPAGLLSATQAERLIDVIQQVLTHAIAQGGTTLKDFVNSEGKPGYFSQQLNVYGRAGLPCLICQQPLQSRTQRQRSTVFCKYCQML